MLIDFRDDPDTYVRESFMKLSEYMLSVGTKARVAADELVKTPSNKKNLALSAISSSIIENKSKIIKANDKDLNAGEKRGLDAASLDRLRLTDNSIDMILHGLNQIAAIPDPIGNMEQVSYRPNGLQIGKMRVPIGVIGIIYESRPNVTVDAAALCLKSGNSVVLRGGSEAFHSNRSLAQSISHGLKKTCLNESSVQFLESVDRKYVKELVRMKDFVDVLVPRGGKSLIELLSKEAKIPLIKHLDGNCHVYIHSDAHLEKANRIAINAKTQRFGVCNAMETLLVDVALAEKTLPKLVESFLAKGVELRLCERSLEIVQLQNNVKKASQSDWAEEYLSPVLSLKLVRDIDEAISHINRFGSKHTDAIVTENYSVARRFVNEIDSSSVIVNASTRFADGFEYGLGAEIGISTDKLHARGPVGLEGLTSQKYVVFGDGHIRE